VSNTWRGDLITLNLVRSTLSQSVQAAHAEPPAGGLTIRSGSVPINPHERETALGGNRLSVGLGSVRGPPPPPGPR